GSDAFSLKPFFDNLGGALATHREIRYAKTILLIGGEPEELQPLTGKQIRQAVRNGGAHLIIANTVPIRLREQAAQLIHINRGNEDAIVLALLGSEDDSLVIEKAGVSQSDLDTLRKSISETRGDLIVMFGDGLSDEGQCLLGQLPYSLSATDRRVLFHLLPLF